MCTSIKYNKFTSKCLQTIFRPKIITLGKSREQIYISPYNKVNIKIKLDSEFYVGHTHLRSATRNFSTLDTAQISAALGLSTVTKSTVFKAQKVCVYEAYSGSKYRLRIFPPQR